MILDAQSSRIPNQTKMKIIRTLSKQVAPVSFAGETFRRYYFENAVSCGECNGAGCKRCYPRHGVESFWEFNYVRRNLDPIMNGVEYTACVNEIARQPLEPLPFNPASLDAYKYQNEND